MKRCIESSLRGGVSVKTGANISTSTNKPDNKAIIMDVTISELSDSVAIDGLYWSDNNLNNNENGIGSGLNNETNGDDLSTEYDKSIYETAVSYLEVRNTNLAIPILIKLTKNPNGEYYQKAMWKLAQAYQISEQPQEASNICKIIIEQDLQFKDNAAELLQELGL